MKEENGKMVKAGVFWVVPDKNLGERVLEVNKRYRVSEAKEDRFINYPRSHLEVWDAEIKGFGDDCYYYPRGRVIYDTEINKHLIYADKCISDSAIDEIKKHFEVEDYVLCRDEHYVCHRCFKVNREKIKLEYNILRGRNAIGENLIEIVYGKTKLLVELGKALNGGDEEREREVLVGKYDAVIVSHYHEDHAGLINEKRDCPVYIGGGAYRILSAMSEYRGTALNGNIQTYRNGRAFKVGGVKITPYLCDHSAFDSYMFLFEAGGDSILYTGDFRFHGRKSSDKLLSELPERVDVLIHEGTNIGKNPCVITESELENRASKIMRSHDNPVFVLQSASNVDRLVSIYRASRRSGRIMYMDNYTSLIAAAAGGSIPRPDEFKDVIAFTPRYVKGKRADMFAEVKAKRSMTGIINGTKRFTMLVRSSMLDYIVKLSQKTNLSGGILIYSVWSGYKEEESTKAFLDGVKALGLTVVDIHTSGHASSEDIELLKRTVSAAETVCVHTEK